METTVNSKSPRVFSIAEGQFNQLVNMDNLSKPTSYTNKDYNCVSEESYTFAERKLQKYVDESFVAFGDTCSQMINQLLEQMR